MNTQKLMKGFLVVFVALALGFIGCPAKEEGSLDKAEKTIKQAGKETEKALKDAGKETEKLLDSLNK
jgi:hypothetical protein